MSELRPAGLEAWRLELGASGSNEAYFSFKLVCFNVTFFFNFRLCRARSAASPVFQEMDISLFSSLLCHPVS